MIFVVCRTILVIGTIILGLGNAAGVFEEWEWRPVLGATLARSVAFSPRLRELCRANLR